MLVSGSKILVLLVLGARFGPRSIGTRISGSLARGGRIVGLYVLVGSNMGRTDVRNWNKLFNVISKDPIGKYILPNHTNNLIFHSFGLDIGHCD